MTEPAKVKHPPQAKVIHHTARRMRLRVPARRHDAGFFRALEAHLQQIPQIEAALARPETATVLLRFAEGDSDAVTAALSALEVLSFTPAGEQSARRLDTVAAAQASAGNALDAVGTAARDRRKLAFAVLVLLLIRRLLRGGYLAPGLALLWLIYEIWRSASTPADNADSQ